VIASRKEIRGADIASHYDELDRFYRDVWGEHVHHGLWLRGDETRAEAVHQLAELVAREAQAGPGSRVMDIGCGYGATSQFLAEHFGAHVTGITISETQHAIAQARSAAATPQFNPPIYIYGDWLTNTLPSESFDAAIAIESSEHMDKAGFFAQAHRVLRPGGRLVVNSWLSRETPTRNQVRWLIEPICREGRMPHLGTESDYRRWAADAGFAVERFQDITKGIERTWPSIVRIFLVKLLTNPAYIRFILDPKSKNAIFGLTILRLWIAFRTGAMHYGVFTLTKK
jgi:tocopherol O-methyltransferase